MSSEQGREGKCTTDAETFRHDPTGHLCQKVRLHGILHEQTHCTYTLRSLEAMLIIVNNEIN